MDDLNDCNITDEKQIISFELKKEINPKATSGICFYFTSQTQRKLSK